MPIWSAKSRKVRVVLFSFSLCFSFVTSALADGFDDVFAIMNQDSGGDSPGCVGCHIGPGFRCADVGRQWGATQDEVLGCITQRGYLDNGRYGTLAEVLGLIDGVPPRMPFFAPFDGRFWNDDELAILGTWLDSL